MHILLTNDDGIDAAGLTALHGAVGPAHRVTVVAPSGERSVCSHASTLDGNLTVRRLQHEAMGSVYAVDGTPVDCVRLAVAELADEPIDCVIAGINRGANVSIVDVSQSGTVAAAREAGFCGIPGIAISQSFRKGEEVDWDRATKLSALLLPQLLSDDAGVVRVWSVNYPAMSAGEMPVGVRIVPLATDQIPLVFGSDDHPLDEQRAYHYLGVYESRTITPGTDVAAVFGNEVAVTPLGIDPTDFPALTAGLTLRI